VRQLGTPALLAATYRGDAAAIAAAAMEELETVLLDSLSQLERLAVSAGAARGPARRGRRRLPRRPQRAAGRLACAGRAARAEAGRAGARAEKADSARADWAHVFLSVLPTLPLAAPGDEARVMAALRAACAKARPRPRLPAAARAAPARAPEPAWACTARHRPGRTYVPPRPGRAVNAQLVARRRWRTTARACGAPPWRSGRCACACRTPAAPGGSSSPRPPARPRTPAPAAPPPARACRAARRARAAPPDRARRGAGHETGEDNVHIYREAAGAGSQTVYASRHSSSEAPGPLDGQPVLAAYPPLEGLQQKRLAARRHKTTYAYDFPSVFGNALRELWTARAVAGEPGTAPKGAPARRARTRERALPSAAAGSCSANRDSAWARAGRLVEVEELVMTPGGTYQRPAQMVPVTRPVGQNDVGVLAWQLTMRTPECPQGRKVRAAGLVPGRRPARAAAALAGLCSRRAAAPAPQPALSLLAWGEARGAGAAQVIAIANDITHNSGAFGPREDAVFRGATELALAERLPLVYLAANSGARVGLAAEVKACLQARAGLRCRGARVAPAL